MRRREEFGVDAPGVVRALLGAGAASIVAGSVGYGLVSAGHSSQVVRFLRDNGFFAGFGFVASGSWMLVSSLWLKQGVLRRLLDDRHWLGDETVLDVGCGRGLVAIGAAKRVAQGGHVTGIDLWLSKDLSGNSPSAAIENARIAGVEQITRFETADACALPYADATFDVVASMTAIHNIPDRDGRRKAIDEVWRVTKPKGQILIFDIFHARSYAAQLRALGATVRVSFPTFLWGTIGWRLSAIKAGR